MKNKILIVDDSATARALFKACVSASDNYEIVEASGWQGALEAAVTHNPVLVVVDYNLPEKLGTEIAKLIINKGLKPKFILMSANTQKSVVDEVKALGFVGVLEKPISAEAVQSILEKVL